MCCWHTVALIPAPRHRSTMRRASASESAIGFSNASPFTACLAASSTIASRTPGGVTKQNRSGSVSASMRSASAYCATSRPNSSAVARIRAASSSHRATISKRSDCASQPWRCLPPRFPQPTCATRIFAIVQLLLRYDAHLRSCAVWLGEPSRARRAGMHRRSCQLPEAEAACCPCGRSPTIRRRFRTDCGTPRLHRRHGSRVR